MSEKVTVVSNCKNIVSIFLPELHLKRNWAKKGAKIAIDKEVLEEAMYDPGVEYMFQSGILYIENMEQKIELGLEPEGATTPQNIIVLTDNEKKEWMSSAKQAWQLKEELEKLSHEGKKDFCDFCIENELLDSKKAAVIKEVCGVDIIRSIQLKQLNSAN